MTAAFHVLLHATTGEGNREHRFRLHTEKDVAGSEDPDAYYLSFHADDWARAWMATLAVKRERRRDNIFDTAKGCLQGVPPKIGQPINSIRDSQLEASIPGGGGTGESHLAGCHHHQEERGAPREGLA